MLIRNSTKIIDHKLEGDTETFTHLQDNSPILELAKISRDTFDKSFMIGRQAWPIAKVPSLMFKKFMDRDGRSIDWKAFDKWLASEEGRPFRAS